jgi:colicin import membrane protein
MALRNDPGFLASSALHGAALALLLFNFSSAPKFEDAAESVPVEMITASELNEISAGEKTAKPLPTPRRRVDKISPVNDQKPLPPTQEAKKDVPLPPSPAKPQDDPGQDDSKVPVPPQRVAALPPPTPAPAPPTVEPEPPRRPAPEPPKAAEEKPPPPDAETVEPKPVPRPKIEPKKEAKAEPPKPEPKAEPKPPQKPVDKKPPVKEAKAPVKEVKEAKAPEPPKKSEKAEPHLKLDELAKLLADPKATKPAAKPKAGNEAKEAPHRDFDPRSISAMLDREAPQRKASTGQKLTQVAALGAPSAHAATLSPSMLAQLDQILIDQYHGCWSYFGLGAAQKYVPEVRVHLAQDGSLMGVPALLNPPGDPNLRSLADSALRAVQKCNPMKIPERFAPYYDSWARRIVRFDPEDML